MRSTDDVSTINTVTFPSTCRSEDNVDTDVAGDKINSAEFSHPVSQLNLTTPAQIGNHSRISEQQYKNN